jgi:acyl-CoA dehydrogenase
LIARTDDAPEIPQAANTAFIVDLPAKGWTVVRDIFTMAGHHNHAEIRIENLRVPNASMLGGRGQGHLLGQARLGPRTIDAYKRDHSTRAATGNLPL